METAETTPERDDLRARIAAAYAPFVALCRLLERRLREQPDDRSPAGWAPYLEALRALRDGRVAGDWDRLAELMVAPEDLPELPDDGRDAIQTAADAPYACLIDIRDPLKGAVTFRELVRALSTAGRRVLVLAPDEATRTAATETLDALPGLLQTKAVPDQSSRPQDERGMRGALLQPGGTGFTGLWDEEGKALRRGLLWLEQWPRDQATLVAVRAQLVAGERQRTEQIQSAHDQVAAAETALERAHETATAAREEETRRAATRRAADEEVAGLRTELSDLQATADTTGQAAAAATAIAEEAHGHLIALTSRQAQCGQDLSAAQQREAFLLDELPRARHALPEAEAEAARLDEATTAADADGHASYYRLAAAESALAAEKRQLSFGQRLRVVPARPETQELRRQLAQRKREADEAARRARQTREAHEKAEAYRQAVAEVIANGEQELVSTREAQERLTTELEHLAGQIEKARAEHDEKARLAGVAVDRATEAMAAARQAAAITEQAEQRAAAARTEHEAATTALQQAEAAINDAERARTAAESGRDRTIAAAESSAAAQKAELEAAEQAELVARQHVAEFCEADPSDLAPAVLNASRDRAMARIEQLDAGPTPADLLAQAAVLCTTPLALATLHDLDGLADFDTLIAYDAGRLTDGDLLIGAIRTHRWILLGDTRSRPRPVPQEYADHLLALAALTRATDHPAPIPEQPTPEPRTFDASAPPTESTAPSPPPELPTAEALSVSPTESAPPSALGPTTPSEHTITDIPARPAETTTPGTPPPTQKPSPSDPPPSSEQTTTDVLALPVETTTPSASPDNATIPSAPPPTPEPSPPDAPTPEPSRSDAPMPQPSRSDAPTPADAPTPGHVPDIPQPLSAPAAADAPPAAEQTTIDVAAQSAYAATPGASPDDETNPGAPPSDQDPAAPSTLAGQPASDARPPVAGRPGTDGPPAAADSATVVDMPARPPARQATPKRDGRTDTLEFAPLRYVAPGEGSAQEGTPTSPGANPEPATPPTGTPPSTRTSPSPSAQAFHDATTASAQGGAQAPPTPRASTQASSGTPTASSPGTEASPVTPAGSAQGTDSTVPDAKATGTLPQPPLDDPEVVRGEESRARVPTLDAAVGIVLARWATATAQRRASVLAEGERLRAAGLWESRYRESYAKVLEHLARDGDPDPEETLLSAANEQRPAIFHRVAQTAPGLCRRLV